MARARVWAVARARLGRVGLMVCVAAASGGGAQAYAQTGNANAGKAVYERKCVLCHGDKGDGKGPGAERLVQDVEPADFEIGHGAEPAARPLVRRRRRIRRHQPHGLLRRLFGVLLRKRQP